MLLKLKLTLEDQHGNEVIDREMQVKEFQLGDGLQAVQMISQWLGGTLALLKIAALRYSLGKPEGRNLDS